MNIDTTPLGSSVPDLAVTHVADKPGALPLSYQQQMYWEGHQQGTVGYRRLDGTEHVANTFGAFRAKGRLQVAVLQQSVNEVLRRHAALRVRLERVGDRDMQIVGDATETPLHYTVATGTVAADRELFAAAAAATAALQQFDYSSGTLLRGHVIEVSSDDHILVLCLPHVVSDSVSVQIVIAEVITLYAHLLRGLPSPLPELLAQYGDFVLWQQQYLHGRGLHAVDDYVSRRLIGARPLLLPVREPASGDAAHASTLVERFALTAAQVSEVHALCKQHRLSPFVVMVSVFSVLLSRWSHQTDILLLAAFSARTDPATQRMIGMFSNLCPLRVDLSGNPSFGAVLEQMAEHVLTAMQYRWVPYAVLADRLGSRGDLGCAGAGVNSVPDGGKIMPRGCAELLADELAIASYVVDPGLIARRHSRSLINFWIGFTAEGGISGRLFYRPSAFDRQTVVQLAEALASSVGVLASRPGIVA